MNYPAINTETYRRVDLSFPQDGHLTLKWVFTSAGEPYVPTGIFQMDVYLPGEKRQYLQGQLLVLSGNELSMDTLLKGKLSGEYYLHEVLAGKKILQATK